MSSWSRPRVSLPALALASAVMGGCASTKASGPTVDDALARRPEAAIQLRSDGCDDGHCPVYSVSIYMDRSVVYRGGANVVLVGQRATKVTSAGLEALVTQLEKMDFIDTPEHCCDCPDAPDDPKATKVVIDYRPGGVEKEVVVDERCRSLPDAIRSLTAQIEAVTAIGPLIIAPPTQVASDVPATGAR